MPLLALILLQPSYLLAQRKAAENITLQTEEISLLELIGKIKEQTGRNFSFDQAGLRGITVKKINWQSKPVDQSMAEIAAKTGIRYHIVGNNVAVAPGTQQQAAVSFILKGRVLDMQTKEPLIGVTVIVQGAQQNAITDASGIFVLRLKDKQAVLLLTYIGYVKKTVKVQAGKGDVEIQLTQDRKLLGEVSVEARRKYNNEAAVLNERKNSAMISDIISARNIEKTASLTTTQALQRVSGVTVTNDKYVSIRGMGDRNVVGQLNGARLTNANADNNSVPLDLVPAGLLENIAVLKSVTPDKPADAAAGIVELRTKSIPDSLSLTFSVQVGTNTTVGLGGDLNSFYNSELGQWGQNVKKKNLSPEFLRLSDEYPASIDPANAFNTYTTSRRIQQFLYSARLTPEGRMEARRIDRIMKSFDPVLTTQYKKSKPNQQYSFSFGNNYKWGKQVFGIVAGANYYYRTEAKQNARLASWSIYQGVGYRYPLFIPGSNTANNVTLNDQLVQTENTGIESLNFGGLLGLSYRPAKGHDISLNFIGNKAAEGQGTSLTGSFPASAQQYPILNQVYSLRQEERMMNTYQGRGKHKVSRSVNPIVFEWNVSFSNGKQNNPDYRFTSVVIDSNKYNYVNKAPGADFWSFLTGTRASVLAGGALYDPNNRAYRLLDEHNQNYQADLTVPFIVANRKHLFKTGYYFLRKERDYREYLQTIPSSAALSAVSGDLDKMIAYDKVALMNGESQLNEGQAYPSGFIYEVAKSINNYKGHSLAEAAYAMGDLQLRNNLRLAGGVRFEKTQVKALLDTSNIIMLTATDRSSTATPVVYNPTFDPAINYSVGFQPYYSVNLIYQPKENLNVRASYNTTLARPELREMIPITQYDPFQFAIVTGNPDLQNQYSQSFDLRAEWFTAPGEVFAVSVYNKLIDGQLTRVYSNDSAGTTANGYDFSQVKFYNDRERGHIRGIELEARKNLKFMGYAFRHFFFNTNLILADSYIKRNKDRLAKSRLIDNYAPEKSPLQYQPAYSLNVSLDYENPKTGTSLTASFNQMGERLLQIVLTGEPDIYDRPVPVLDFVFRQRILKKWAVKGFAKNLLNPPYKEVYTNYGNKGLYFGKEYVRRAYYRGTEIMIGLTYDIF